MKNLLTPGRFLFGVAITAFGVQHFIYAITGAGIGPPWTPLYHFLAYFLGFVLSRRRRRLDDGDSGAVCRHCDRYRGCRPRLIGRVAEVCRESHATPARGRVRSNCWRWAARAWYWPRRGETPVTAPQRRVVSSGANRIRRIARRVRHSAPDVRRVCGDADPGMDAR